MPCLRLPEPPASRPDHSLLLGGIPIAYCSSRLLSAPSVSQHPFLPVCCWPVYIVSSFAEQTHFLWDCPLLGQTGGSEVPFFSMTRIAKNREALHFCSQGQRRTEALTRLTLITWLGWMSKKCYFEGQVKEEMTWGAADTANRLLSFVMLRYFDQFLEEY